MCFCLAPLVLTMEEGSSVSSTRICKRCRNKSVNGYTCQVCSSVYHPRCAKYNSDIKYISDDVIICCDVGKSTENLVQENFQLHDVNVTNLDEDEAFYNAINGLADAEGKVDVNILKYIIKQKDSIIDELKEKINPLTEYNDLLKGRNTDKLSVQTTASDRILKRIQFKCCKSN